MPFRVFRSLAEVGPDFGPSAVTIGNFDGVHAGHRMLMRRVRELSRTHHWKASLLTFDPHPSMLVAPGRAPRLLTSIDQRLELMSECGIEQVLVLPFTWEVAKLTAEEFVSQILAHRMRARAVVVGDNFRFGNRQAGDAAKLAELGETHGFRTESVGELERRGRVVSSTEIRKLLGAGDVRIANRLLERPYALEGVVATGHGIGRSRTVPTLNLATEAEVIPQTGVYITRTTDLDHPARRWNSVSNIGYRPTFHQGSELSIESFLLSPFDGEAPARMRVEFLERIREERRFESAEALKAQILRDAGTAAKFFRRIARTL